jgi:hypothetical protein
VPAATPIPRGPTVLTLYTAADLLTGPGCPVCRYADEAGDRYLAWFALEGHADAVTITRLCSSLGMCPRHTRGLMSQPGAARRLTAVYRYVMGAARDHLNGRAARPGVCPACRHDDAAAGRALETLIEGLADDCVRERYRELGGLCLPHLGSASARADRRLAAWLSQTLAATVATWPTSAGWLAGTDRDAEIRAVLRRAAPASARSGSGVCLACLAAGHSEQSHLAEILRASDRSPDRHLLLCAGHLSDLAVLTGGRDVAPMLGWQTGCLVASLKPGHRARWPWPRCRRVGGPGGCPVCLAAGQAAQRALEDFRVLLRGSRPARGHPALLCVRHLLGLRALDRGAGQVAALGGVERADMLVAELNEAFGKGTWARSHEARGPEMTAWRRAAAFLDGGVFCGCPPQDTTR